MSGFISVVRVIKISSEFSIKIEEMNGNSLSLIGCQ
jgi:hypothetical protein